MDACPARLAAGAAGAAAAIGAAASPAANPVAPTRAAPEAKRRHLCPVLLVGRGHGRFPRDAEDILIGAFFPKS
jgi:hypothetical protein